MQSLLYLLLTLAILVIVHEYGHFWVARRCGVKVLKFSVGFGKPLWTKIGKSGTEYTLSWIPLGGFVKMLDEREGSVHPDEVKFAFNQQSLGARTAIVAAGPVANLLFAIVAYWLIFMMGIPGLKPVIAEVEPETAASYAQLVAGDDIKAVNGRVTPTWNSVNRALSQIAEEGGVAELTLDYGESEIERQLVIARANPDIALREPLLASLGLKPIQFDFEPRVALVVENSAAERAGLEVSDQIISIDNSLVTSWFDVVNRVQSNPNKPLGFVVERNGENIRLQITPKESDEGKGLIGVQVDTSHPIIADDLLSIEQYGFIDSLGKASYQTWSFSAATLKSLAGMVLGRVSSENIGGPITIAQYASTSAKQGLIAFISFLAMISISLGLLNLLPIPVLDGGHLMLYLIEWIRGEPLADATQFQIQKVGIILLVMLMFLAFFNDLSRLFG